METNQENQEVIQITSDEDIIESQKNFFLFNEDNFQKRIKINEKITQVVLNLQHEFKEFWKERGFKETSLNFEAKILGDKIYGELSSQNPQVKDRYSVSGIVLRGAIYTNCVDIKNYYFNLIFIDNNDFEMKQLFSMDRSNEALEAEIRRNRELRFTTERGHLPCCVSRADDRRVWSLYIDDSRFDVRYDINDKKYIIYLHGAVGLINKFGDTFLSTNYNSFNYKDMASELTLRAMCHMMTENVPKTIVDDFKRKLTWMLIKNTEHETYFYEEEM